MGNTIQVRLGALTIPLVAFWLKRVLGSRDCPQVGKVPCSFFNCLHLLLHVHVHVGSFVPCGSLLFVLFFCAAAGLRHSLMRWLGRIEARLVSVRCQSSM